MRLAIVYLVSTNKNAASAWALGGEIHGRVTDDAATDPVDSPVPTQRELPGGGSRRAIAPVIAQRRALIVPVHRR